MLYITTRLTRYRINGKLNTNASDVVTSSRISFLFSWIVPGALQDIIDHFGLLIFSLVQSIYSVDLLKFDLNGYNMTRVITFQSSRLNNDDLLVSIRKQLELLFRTHYPLVFSLHSFETTSGLFIFNLFRDRFYIFTFYFRLGFRTFNYIFRLMVIRIIQKCRVSLM